MLDVIQTKGTPSSRQLYLVGEFYLQEFQGTEGDYDQHRQIIVAAANYRANGELFDWAAYKGIPPVGCDEDSAHLTVSQFGDKLSEREVKFYLHGQPNLNALLKRYRD